MTTPSDCPVCLGQGMVERMATPEEVDDGHELGVAYDPCWSCCGHTEHLTATVTDLFGSSVRAFGLRATDREWEECRR